MEKKSFQVALVTAILSSLQLDDQIIRTEAWSPETVSGTGTVTVEISKWVQAAPNVHAWIVDLSVLGMTFSSEDPDKSIIKKMHEDCLRSCTSLPSNFFVLPEGASIAGILPVKNSELRENEDQFMFTVDFGLAIVNTPF